MLKTARIKTWEFSDLSNWLVNVGTMEDESFDLKKHYTADTNPASVRKCFSSFANAKGGFVFFGIDDSKKPVGCVEDSQVVTKLNRVLTDNLDPRINWKMIHSIRVPTRRSSSLIVYVVQINESIFIDKPHISDGKIYIRESGECKEVKTNHQLRLLFFTSPFYPEHIEQLEHELEKIKSYEYKGSTINSVYLMNLRRFLEEAGNHELKRDRKKNLEKLKGYFSKISSLIDGIERERSKQTVSRSSPPISTNTNLVKLYDALGLEVDKFISLFKAVYIL